MGKSVNNDIKEITRVINRNFSQISSGFLIKSEDISNIDELRKFLSAQIKIMLEEKYDKLINILYRIDIDDKKIVEAFSIKDKQMIPGLIADLIIERQIQKIHFRKIYKEGNL
jgi:hypothetical protein